MGLDLIPVLTFSGMPERGENVPDMPTECVIVVQHCRLHCILLKNADSFWGSNFLRFCPSDRLTFTFFFFCETNSPAVKFCKCLQQFIHLCSSYVAQ